MRRRIHAFYSGRVHGVGFRAAAEEAAGEHSLVGWVRNLPDGRVEVIAEGEEAALERFLDALQCGAMKRFIERIELTWSNASEAFDRFEIRYS
ncbi:MAG: acylphosphatase [Candidatus Omnitrophica bacterium]|nr:acylphosphatase [Candidatus Omnitrophota bacterium]